MLKYFGLVFAIFLVICNAELPVEEVVYPRVLEARGLNGEKMLYVRDGLTLSLEKSTVFSENFVFSEHDGEKQYDRTVSGKDLENNLYHNIKHGSSLLIDESNGKVQVRGLLSDLLSIEPLLAAEEADNGAVAHKISKLDKSQIRLDDSVRELNIPEVEAQYNYHQVGRSLENLPEEIKVEVLIISDHVHNENKTEKELIDHFSILINQVNLKYKELTKPSVQLVVVGIIKSKSEPYAKTEYNEDRKEVLIDVCGTLAPLTSHISRTFERKSMDAVLFVSGLNHAGIAPVCANLGSLCRRNRVSALSLRQASDDYSANLIGHVMGHMLGMAHESHEPIFSTTGVKRICPPEERGILMGGKGPHQFSECVKDQMRGYLMTLPATCFEQTGGKPIF
ncbi:uncharacterized protein LOC8053500 [Ixodes scapularis]|uniref:uncharacterized protein LOC8053500 n=1 Tax=Ixodes scapularis TaxID=6945 RepID=UPI001A9E9799|nr:uncharacterized protein LOC8053500 [Ixodes scapularis]